jgi:hypothetical protein
MPHTDPDNAASRIAREATPPWFGEPFTHRAVIAAKARHRYDAAFPAASAFAHGAPSSFPKRLRLLGSRIRGDDGGGKAAHRTPQRHFMRQGRLTAGSIQKGRPTAVVERS